MQEPGTPPHWAVYVTVDDLEGAARRAKELGGELLAEPFDVLDVGRMAVVKDPVGEMQKVYAGIGLDGFDAYHPKLEEYLSRNAGYETNKYQLTDADRDEVTKRWGDVIRRYGYA